MNQTPYRLVFASCHRMSDFPSPSKSPVLIITQERGGEPITSAAFGPMPFISQIPTWPVELFRHRISCMPSPSKSGGLGTVTTFFGGETSPDCNSPKTPTEFMVPTNTLPLQTVGGTNFIGAPILTPALE